MKPDRQSTAELPTILFADQSSWTAWLDENHASSQGLWIKFAKKASALRSVSYAEALETALCFGWIDGQKRSCDADSWLLKFTPRRARSIWSKINRAKANELIQSGRMQPAGFAEIERAKKDGRWDAAYDSVKAATVPDDLQMELDRHPQAKAFFATLNSRNRYAILFRIQTAKKAETRAKRITQFIGMLENQEALHP